MPTTSRAFLKSGMLFFMGSLISGVLMQFKPGLSAQLVPLFWHMLMVGWITQIIIGVSLWMFPGRSKTEDLKSQFLSWVIFGTLNLGLVLRFITEPFASGVNNGLISTGLILSAVLQGIAGLCYLLEMWPRVMSQQQAILKRKAKREAS